MRKDVEATRQARVQCAEIAEAGRAEGMTQWEIVYACRAVLPNVTLLAIHRMIRGWTLVVAVQALSGLARAMGGEAGVTPQLLSRWETGSSRPAPAYVNLLCRAYQTRPDRLGFGEDHTPIAELRRLDRVPPIAPEMTVFVTPAKGNNGGGSQGPRIPSFPGRN